MRSCEDYIADMNLSIDGLLEPEQEQELQAHLAQCQKCRSLYRSYQDIQAAILETEEVPPKGLTHSVMERIHAEKARHSPKETLKRMRFTLTAAVIALVVVAAGKYLGSPTSQASTAAAVAASASEAATADAGDGTAFAPRVATQAPEQQEEAAEAAEAPMLGAVPDDSQLEPDSDSLLADLQAQLEAAGEQGSIYLLHNSADDIQRLLPDAQTLSLSSDVTVYKVTEADYASVRAQLTEAGGAEDMETDFVYLYPTDS